MPKEFSIKRSRKKHLILWIVVTLILAIIGFYGYRLLFLKNFAAQSQKEIAAQLEEARQALSNFDPDAAHDSFVAIDSELKTVQDEATKYGVLSFTGLFDKFKDVPDTLKNLSGISSSAVHLSEDVSFLKENGVQLMLSGRGDELLERLHMFQQKLATLTDYINSLDKQRSQFDAKTQNKLIQLRAEIDASSKALAALATFLGSDAPRHLLVLFQNPTEMRPAGGFIGSYADISITKGAIEDISVRDIYDPDGQLDLKVVPPKTLQLITTKWGARDANWFFDYPTSAKKVMYFLDNSKIYSEKNVTFSGAITMNTNVLTDVIKLIGEIPLPEYDTVITADNFLGFVQKEVESGADKKVNQPKKILQILTPKLIEKLSTLSSEQKQALVKLFEYHLTHKNIMAYVDDSALQLYAKTVGLAGDVAIPSSRTISEYLAVVNTNVAGGKSDAFMSQDIDFKSSISETGEITNAVTLTRRHTGQKQKEWWYKATNKNYLQIYTTLGSRILGSAGRDKWPTDPKNKYKGFTTDSDITAIESTDYFLADLGLDRFIAFDKTVFAAWLNTPAGKTKTFTLMYKNPARIDPTSNAPFEFIFDKQSGASTTLSVAIDAPPTYKWKETNSPTLTYQSNDPPGRVRIRQTLIPIR